MTVADIGDDEDKEAEYLKRCSVGELNGMYLNAAREGDWPRIERLLAAGAELDYAGGGTLTAAIDGGHIDVARKLLARGLNPTAHVRQEALGDAVYADNPAAAAFLIAEAKADPAWNDSAVLFSAVVNNRPAMTRLLLEKGAKPDANKGTLLCIALSHGFVDTAEALLDNGADPRKTHLGMNAYEWAAKERLSGLSKKLRDAARTDAYMSPGFFERQSLSELRGFYDERQRESGFHLAARAGCFDIIRDKFLASPADKLRAEDLTRREPGGKDVLTLLGDAGGLGLAFDPRLWLGRKDEALALLDKKLPKEFAQQVDGAAFVAALDRETLKARAKNAPLKLKKT